MSDLISLNIRDVRSGRTDVRLGTPQWSSLWRANVRLVDRYRNGRVLLAGDAAHIHSPAGGQGMNTGIQDAHNLGWKLAAVINGAEAELLDTYEAERRPVAASVLALSDARLAQALEQHAMPVNRSVDTTQLGITYRGSVLARDERDDIATLRAGDRAPDATHPATNAGERRLFDLLHGVTFTVLDFTGGRNRERVRNDVRVLDVVARPAGSDDIVDTKGHLAAAYGATAHTVVLIRPDGYIAAITDVGDFGMIEAYLAAHSCTCARRLGAVLKL